MIMDEIEKNLNMKKCPKCGKYSKMALVRTYGTCLCGEVLDGKAKFNYEMTKRLRLWQDKKSKFRGIIDQ